MYFFNKTLVVPLLVAMVHNMCIASQQQHINRHYGTYSNYRNTYSNSLNSDSKKNYQNKKQQLNNYDKKTYNWNNSPNKMLEQHNNDIYNMFNDKNNHNMPIIYSNVHVYYNKDENNINKNNDSIAKDNTIKDNKYNFDPATIMDITNSLIKISNQNKNRKQIFNSLIEENIESLSTYLSNIKSAAYLYANFSEILNNVINYNETLLAALKYYSECNNKQNNVYYNHFKKISWKFIRKTEKFIAMVDKFPNCNTPYQKQLSKLQKLNKDCIYQASFLY
ncbi:MAG: hypothetical protein IJU54_02135 [Alphaproteobacteria bacterium]|nr:hypothetical protein [Alphaproteobacteria bacterium]